MQLPRALARFNRLVTNRLFAPLAGRVPPWVLLEHRGRRSGGVYRTVLMAFAHDNDLVVALTYGPTTDWVKNVLAAQSCRVKHAGRWRTFSSAELLEGERALALLPLVRIPLRMTGLTHVLRLRSG
jgi:deazaflavin-dependent oxidoreductase (nitroreductase family)